MKRSKEEKDRLTKEIHKKLRLVVTDCLDILADNDIATSISAPVVAFPIDQSIKVKSGILMGVDLIADNSNMADGSYSFAINGTLSEGFARRVYAIFRIQNDETKFCSISLTLVTPGNRTKAFLTGFIRELCAVLANRSYQSNGWAIFSPRVIFEGIANIDDNFRDYLTIEVAKVLQDVLSHMSSEVAEKLEIKKRIEMGLTPPEENDPPAPQIFI